MMAISLHPSHGRGQTGSTGSSERAGGNIERQALIAAAAAAVGLSGAAAAFIGGITGLVAYECSRPHGVWGEGEPPEGLAEDVEFVSAADGTFLRGWYMPTVDPRRSPTVLLCHGAWTGRRECLPLALRFNQAGYNVLTFDFRAHGMSGGRFISIGFNEAQDVLGAVSWLLDRQDVDPERIGIVGFSMGAAAAIRAAAQTPHIRAVVADSAYASFVDAVQYSFRVVGHLPTYPFAALALRWVKWLTRIDPNDLTTVDSVRMIAPRPLFLIHGQADEIVPARHATLLFKAAEEPKELWLAPEAWHVGARDLYPDEYFERVECFLRQALAPGAHAPYMQPFGHVPALAAA